MSIYVLGYFLEVVLDSKYGDINEDLWYMLLIFTSDGISCQVFWQLYVSLVCVFFSQTQKRMKLLHNHNDGEKSPRMEHSPITPEQVRIGLPLQICNPMHLHLPQSASHSQLVLFKDSKLDYLNIWQTKVWLFHYPFIYLLLFFYFIFIYSLLLLLFLLS